jgi:hypothetical protein
MRREARHAGKGKPRRNSHPAPKVPFAIPSDSRIGRQAKRSVAARQGTI